MGLPFCCSKVRGAPAETRGILGSWFWKQRPSCCTQWQPAAAARSRKSRGACTRLSSLRPTCSARAGAAHAEGLGPVRGPKKGTLRRAGRGPASLAQIDAPGGARRPRPAAAGAPWRGPRSRAAWAPPPPARCTHPLLIVIFVHTSLCALNI